MGMCFRFFCLISASEDSTSNPLDLECKWSCLAQPRTNLTYIRLKLPTMKCTEIYWKKTLNCIQSIFEVENALLFEDSTQSKGGNPVKIVQILFAFQHVRHAKTVSLPLQVLYLVCFYVENRELRDFFSLGVFLDHLALFFSGWSTSSSG